MLLRKPTVVTSICHAPSVDRNLTFFNGCTWINCISVLDKISGTSLLSSAVGPLQFNYMMPQKSCVNPHHTRMTMPCLRHPTGTLRWNRAASGSKKGRFNCVVTPILDSGSLQTTRTVRLVRTSAEPRALRSVTSEPLYRMLHCNLSQDCW